MITHYKEVRVIVKELGDYIFKSPYGIHLIEPNEYELEEAVKRAKAEDIKIISVYL